MFSSLPIFFSASRLTGLSSFLAGMKFSLDQILEMTQKRSVSPRPREDSTKRAHEEFGLGPRPVSSFGQEGRVTGLAPTTSGP